MAANTVKQRDEVLLFPELVARYSGRGIRENKKYITKGRKKGP